VYKRQAYNGVYKVNYDSTFYADTVIYYENFKTLSDHRLTYNFDISGVYALNEQNELLKYDIASDSLINLKKGIAGQSVQGMFNADDKIYAYDLAGSVYSLENGGTVWTLLSKAPKVGGKNQFYAADGFMLINKDPNYPGRYSTDGGVTWQVGAFAHADYVYSDGTISLVSDAGDGFILKSTNQGKNWTKFIDHNGGSSAILIDEGTYLFASYDNKVLMMQDSINIDTTLTPSTVRSIVVSGGYYFGGTDSGVVKIDRPNIYVDNFYKISVNPEWSFTGLEGKKILSLTSDTTGVIYAGTEDGTYYSADLGANWDLYGTVVSGNLKKTSVSGLSQVKALLANGAELLAAADEGLYRTKIYKAIATEDEPNIAPASFELKQNYPNPFNPVTNISFKLPAAAKVKLTVYDMLGREVETLVNMQLGQGSYSYRFDGHNLSSGVYIYSLEAGSVRMAKKMMLIK
jgi:hypothetical protein